MKARHSGDPTADKYKSAAEVSRGGQAADVVGLSVVKSGRESLASLEQPGSQAGRESRAGDNVLKP